MGITAYIGIGIVFLLYIWWSVWCIKFLRGLGWKTLIKDYPYLASEIAYWMMLSGLLLTVGIILTLKTIL